MPSKEMETAAGDGGAGHLPEHFDGADGATTKNGMHPCSEYDNVALEALERGQASAGRVAGEDIHGAMVHSAGRIRADEGDENSHHALRAQMLPPRMVARA